MTSRYTTTADNVTTRAADAREAADKIARRLYGRRGYCRTIRHNCRTEDGRSHTYEAFIGRDVPRDPGTTSGRNVWIYETREG